MRRFEYFFDGLDMRRADLFVGFLICVRSDYFVAVCRLWEVMGYCVSWDIVVFARDIVDGISYGPGGLGRTVGFLSSWVFCTLRGCGRY